MAVEKRIITEEEKKNAVSKTGRMLYDEESKLWWSGPSEIAQMYRNEKISGKACGSRLANPRKKS